jgi:glutamate:GABA antiporter
MTAIGATSHGRFTVTKKYWIACMALDGNMPPVFNRHNKYGSPVAILVTQALIGSAISLLYVILPSVNQAYWIMSAMTVELLCIMHVLIFAALIKLRYSKPDQPRPFKIPGGMAGIWIVGGLGGIGVAFAFIVGLIPPDIFPNAPLYVGSVLLGTFLLAVPPLVFMKFKKPSWAVPEDQGD